MFEYPVADSITPDTIVKNAWIRIQPSRIGYSRVKKYTQITLYYGYAPGICEINTYVNDSLIRFDDIESTEGFNNLKWNFETTPKNFMLKISGLRSPEFYAFSLESDSGVIVDNIAMRGSSGTLFRKMYKPQFRQFLKDQPVGLFLLQYGGNTIPYIDSKEEVIAYGRWFKAQLKYIQSIKPDAAIVVIGPSDMALKTDNNFETYPYLEDVNEVLKNAAFETGCGFWDLYDVMGGRNSMTSWVESDPPLAGADYVHFTQRGTRKVAELFYKALMQDRADWKAENKKKRPPMADEIMVK
jgi:lysophospholipase L1-like esterase